MSSTLYFAHQSIYSVLILVILSSDSCLPVTHLVPTVLSVFFWWDDFWATLALPHLYCHVAPIHPTQPWSGTFTCLIINLWHNFLYNPNLRRTIHTAYRSGCPCTYMIWFPLLYCPARSVHPLGETWVSLYCSAHVALHAAIYNACMCRLTHCSMMRSPFNIQFLNGLRYRRAYISGYYSALIYWSVRYYVWLSSTAFTLARAPGHGRVLMTGNQGKNIHYFLEFPISL